MSLQKQLTASKYSIIKVGSNSLKKKARGYLGKKIILI